MRVKYNEDNDDLFCNECKDRIHIGEKYGRAVEECLGEKIVKPYHTECIPIDDEDEINEQLDNASEEDQEDYFDES